MTQNPLNSADGKYSIPTLSIVDHIKHVKPIQLDDFRFLQSLTAGKAVPKVCIPSPTMAHFRGGRAAVSEVVYPDVSTSVSYLFIFMSWCSSYLLSPVGVAKLEDFFTDLATAYRAEIRSLYDAGCRFIQLDDTNLAYLCDAQMRAAATGRGENVVSSTSDVHAIFFALQPLNIPHLNFQNTLPDRYAALINACIKDRPKDLVIGMHLCRGNFRSQFFASG